MALYVPCSTCLSFGCVWCCCFAHSSQWLHIVSAEIALHRKMYVIIVNSPFHTIINSVMLTLCRVSSVRFLDDERTVSRLNGQNASIFCWKLARAKAAPTSFSCHSIQKVLIHALYITYIGCWRLNMPLIFRTSNTWPSLPIQPKCLSDNFTANKRPFSKMYIESTRIQLNRAFVVHQIKPRLVCRMDALFKYAML